VTVKSMVSSITIGSLTNLDLNFEITDFKRKSISLILLHTRGLKVCDLS